MKIALLFYHSVYDDEIHRMLQKLGCLRYVEVPRAWAQDDDEKRFDTHIFPGTDAIIMAFVEEPCAERLKAAVAEFRTGRQKEHTHLALAPLEQFV